MRHTNYAILSAIFLAALIVSSCNPTNKPGEKVKTPAEKEQETTQKTDTLISGTQAEKQTDITKQGNLDFLKEFNGKYPNDVKLLDNPVLTQRLKKLLGDRFTFLKETWAVETPIEIKNNIFVASGCQAHNCDNTNFLLVVDFSKNIVYAGVREEENVKLYAEDGSDNPELNKWQKKMNIP